MLFQTWLDLLLVKQLSWREARRLSTKPRDKPAGLSLNSNPTRDTNFDQTVRMNGGATRDRTADLLDANQTLSQLSYSPI